MGQFSDNFIALFFYTHLFEGFARSCFDKREVSLFALSSWKSNLIGVNSVVAVSNDEQ